MSLDVRRHTIRRYPLRASAACALGLLLSLTGCQAARHVGHSGTDAQPPSWNICFSPRGGCTQLVVDTIASANSQVLVQAHSFTSEPIAQALVAARQRGVRVEAILDKSQRSEDDSRAALLARAGIPVSIDAAHAIAHNKVMVMDEDTVVTGSFNFTNSAEERNAENLLVIKDKALASAYRENWRKHRAHSQPFVP
ncbi:MAG: phospholipase D family protein [Candidatus Omnitrophica bacterium]|nr:phospholipase D family protein [Candidatus Omnitrophota bacterium]